MSQATAHVRTARRKGPAAEAATEEATVARRSVRPVARPLPRTRGVGQFLANLLTFLAFVGMCAAFLVVPNKPETVVILAIGLTVALCIVRWPIVGTLTCLVLAILFDSLPSIYVHTILSEAGVFRNLSYKGLPQAVWLSMFEVIVVLTLCSAVVRRWHLHEKATRGKLFFPIMAFGAVVMFGEVNGLLSGGDFKISLWELRPLGYTVVLYILAVNTVNKPWHVRALIWTTALSVAVRSLEGISRFLSLTPDLRANIPVVLEHDDTLVLVVALMLLVPVLLWRKQLQRRLLWTLVAMAPIVLYVVVINHRRAAYMAIILTLASMVPFIWISVTSKEARLKLVTITGIVLVLGAMYVAAFWNSNGGIAQPAQAVRSIFAPDERDYLSNLYRDQENTNLYATISRSPIVGIGFGKPMDVVVRMVDLTDIWALQLYMPHNNVLWLWMRMGLIGFGMYWIMVGWVLIVIWSSVRLGVKRLVYLKSVEPQAETGEAKKVRGLNADVPGLRLVHLKPKEDPSKVGRLRDQALARVHRDEVRECAEFLVLCFMALASLMSMLTLAQVDQGLMSPRLSSYWGLVLGTMTVASETFKITVKLPARIAQALGAIGALGTASHVGRRKELEDAKRSRVRVITGPQNAA